MTESQERNPVEILADEFVERRRRGERPSLLEYTRQHPELAEDIRELFPLLVEMEDVRGDGSRDSAPVVVSHPELKQLGDYRIIREVGRGGMGIVYEAEQVSLSRHVALKVLPRELLENPKHRSRFEREAKAAAKLHHTNIVPVFGVGEDDGQGYYVMQFIQGLSLDEVLDELKRTKDRSDPSGGTPTSGKLPVSRRDLSAAEVAKSLMTGRFQPPADDEGSVTEPGRFEVTCEPTSQRPFIAPASGSRSSGSTGRLSDSFSLSDSSVVLPGGSSSHATRSSRKRTYWESVALIGVQVAQALQYAHGQNILHRDIKPSNLLLDVHGTVWVTDFGLAKLEDEMNLTQSGDVLGTLRYMAPETFKGQADELSEIYSLGLTLYEMLAFRPAFDQTQRNPLIEQVISAQVEPLGKLNPDIPADLQTIVHKTIDSDPKHRYQTAGELADDLQRFVDDEPIHARRVSTSERFLRWSRRNRALATALSLVAALLIFVAVGSTLAAGYFRGLTRELTRTAEDLKEAVARADGAVEEARTATKKAEAARKAAAREANAKALSLANEQEATSNLKLALTESERQREIARRSIYTASMSTAARLLRSPDEGAARLPDLLAGMRPLAGESDLRGWEWYYANSFERVSRLKLRPHEHHIHKLSYSPDGSLGASAGHDNTVQVWDAESGDVVMSFSGHTDWVWDVAWSPSGRHLFSSSADDTVRMWDIDGGKEIQKLTHTRTMHGLGVSPDGKYLAAGTALGALIWNVEDGVLLNKFAGHLGTVGSVSWNPTGDRLATGGTDGSILIWNPASADRLTVMRGLRGNVRAIVWYADQRIASAGSDGTVRIWNVETGEEIRSLKGHTGQVRDLDWSPERNLLVSGGSDGIVRFWDPEHDQKAGPMDIRATSLNCVQFRKGGRELATGGSADNTIQVWTIDKDAGAILANTSDADVVAYSPDRKRLASVGVGAGLSLRVWDRRTRRRLFDWREESGFLELVEQAASTFLQATSSRSRSPASYYSALAWSPDSARIAVGADNGSISIMNAESGELSLKLEGHEDNEPINDIAWSPDGSLLASAGEDHQVVIWDARDGKESRNLAGHQAAVQALDWSDDGLRLVSVDDAGETRVWNVQTGSETATFGRTGDRLVSVKFRPREPRQLLTGGSSTGSNAFSDHLSTEKGVIRLWDLESQTELLAFDGYSGAVASVDFSADGTRVLSASRDGLVVVWDAESGRELLTLQSSEQNELNAARFSPDGLEVAAAGSKHIELWDTFRGHARELSPLLLPPLDERIAAGATGEDLELRGRIRASLGQWEEAAEDFRKLAELDDRKKWFLTPWWVVGPYPEELDASQPPERHLDPNRPIPVSGADAEGDMLHWSRIVLDQGQGLDMGQLFHYVTGVSGYAQLRVYSSAEQKVALLFGADDSVKLWFNGETIHVRPEIRTATRDDEALEVSLRPGWNTILAKVSNRAKDHGLFLRLSEDPVELARVYDHQEDWAAAFDQWSKIVASRPTYGSLMSHARSAVYTDHHEEARTSFEQALALAPSPVDARRNFAYIHVQRANELLEDQEARRSLLVTAKQLYEAVLTEDPEQESVVRALADVVFALRPREDSWSVLRPTRMESKGGATMTLLPDDSILVGGELPDADEYSIVAETDERRVVAMRLEALTHPSLPANGPGRAVQGDRGNFALIGGALHESPRSRPDQVEPIVLKKVAADYFSHRLGLSVGHWNISGGTSKPHEAVYLLAEPVEAESGLRIDINLKFNVAPEWPGQSLGRFRLSTTSDPEMFRIAEERFAAMSIADPWARLAAAYSLAGEREAAERFLTKQRNQIEASAAFEVHQRFERWNEAADHGLLLVEIRPDDTLLWLRVAPVVFLADDKDAYDKFRARMTRQFDGTKDPVAVQRILHACLLAPDTKDLSGLPVDALADISEDDDLEPWFLPWLWSTRALVALRGGQPELAVRHADRSDRSKPVQLGHAMNLGIAAMAHHQLGERDAARRALGELSAIVGDQTYVGRHNQDLLIARILLRQAETLIEGDTVP